jgi:hypothetical protein
MNFAKHENCGGVHIWIESTQPKWDAQQVCSEYGLLTGIMIKVVREDHRVTGM